MKRIILAGALALTSVAAHAEPPQLPAQFVGNWCKPMGSNEPYRRVEGECNQQRYTIGRSTMEAQDGDSGPGVKCKLRRVLKVRADDYVARYHCVDIFAIGDDFPDLKRPTMQFTLRGDCLVVRD